MKSHSTISDTRSPWTDAFRAGPGAPATAMPAMAAGEPTRPGAAFAPAAPHPSLEPDGLDREADGWACEALFILYNPG